MKTLLIALAFIVSLSGCAWVEDNPNTARAAVYVGTLKYVGEDAERAQRVEKAALDILVTLSGSTTVAQLDNQLRQRIDWARLDMADRILLDALLTELADTIFASVGEGLLLTEDKVRIERVGEWVISAARLAQ